MNKINKILSNSINIYKYDDDFVKYDKMCAANKIYKLIKFIHIFFAVINRPIDYEM